MAEERKLRVLIGVVKNVTAWEVGEVFLHVTCRRETGEPLAKYLEDMPGSMRFVERIARVQWWCGTRDQLDESVAYLHTSRGIAACFNSPAYDLYSEWEEKVNFLDRKAKGLLRSFEVIGAQFGVAVSISTVPESVKKWTATRYSDQEQEGYEEKSSGWEVTFSW